MNNDNLETLLTALSDSLSDEELLLSLLQSDIAATIASKRVASGLSQREFADALGVSQGLVSRWESGDANFTLLTLVRIALKLGIEMKSPYTPDMPPHSHVSGNVVNFPPSGWRMPITSDNPIWNRKIPTTVEERIEM